MALTRERVLEALCAQVERLRERDTRLPAAPVTPESSVMTDLGFDSISVVELVCAVEQALCIQELPLQSWLAEESEREDGRFTVSSFVDFAIERGAPPDAR
jgi:acyl carrier protein